MFSRAYCKTDTHKRDLAAACLLAIDDIKKDTNRKFTFMRKFKRDTGGKWAQFMFQRVHISNPLANCFCLEGLIARHYANSIGIPIQNQAVPTVFFYPLYPYTEGKSVHYISDHPDDWSDQDIIDILQRFVDDQS